MADAAHAKPHHDYHLVNPSPWPAWGASSAFLTAVGAILWMHHSAAYAPIIQSQNATIVAAQSTSNPGLFQVQITYNFSQFSFAGLSSLVPLPAAQPTATVTVSNGGY